MSRKQKYYLRGIGVGIVVCALILIISRINSPVNISDDEIVSRARALGMVDPGDMSLSEASGQAGTESAEPGVSGTGSEENPNAADGSGNAEGPGTPDGSGTADVADTTDDPGTVDVTADPDSTSGDPDDSSADTSGDPSGDANADPQTADPATTEDHTSDGDAQSSTDAQPTGEYAVVVVERGNSSDTVAQRCQNLGLVSDYRDFDRYLVDNGYANRICVGTFQIPYGSSYEFIAKTITNSL
ncbi:MAG: hypothetical protein K5871_00725 [Lachnospiraceae bacterium]|nr:hypothetical protein [Lachnospiraceae bacterium]